VPQTGNAVEGFCPGLVQVCAKAPEAINKQLNTKMIFIPVGAKYSKAVRRGANILLN
jgi:hypothetical protein